MTRAEAAQILTMLAAPYPGELEADAIEVWYHAALSNCPYPEGLEITKLLVSTEERRPTPARFNSERTRRRQLEHTRSQAQRALPPATRGPASTDVARAAISEARDALAQAQEKR